MRILIEERSSTGTPLVFEFPASSGEKGMLISDFAEIGIVIETGITRVLELLAKRPLTNVECCAGATTVARFARHTVLL